MSLTSFLRAVDLRIRLLLFFALIAGASVASGQVVSVNVTGTQTTGGTIKPGGTVIYTVVLTNSGNVSQLDNPGNEFSETLPPSLTLVSAIATAGTAIANPPGDEDGGVVTWNGVIAPGASVTITISADIHTSAAGQIVTTQGAISFDSDFDGINESSGVTDDPTVGGANDPNVFTLDITLISGAQTVTGTFTPGGHAIYTIVLSNNGTATQADNPGDEFAETLPSELQLLGATATAGTLTVSIDARSVTWNGAIAAGQAVTITIETTIHEETSIGTVVSAQGTFAYDADQSGDNETVQQTFAPPRGDSDEPTTFQVKDYSDVAYVFGTRPADIKVLSNDVVSGVTLTIIGATNGQHGTVSIAADHVRYTPTAKLPPGGDSFTYTALDSKGGTYTATVTVRDFSEASASFNGLVNPPQGSAPVHERAGVARVTIAKSGAFTGTLTIGGTRYPFTGTFDSLGKALFNPRRTPELVLKRPVPRGQPALLPLKLSIQIGSRPELDEVFGFFTENGNDFASFTAERAFYNARTNPVPASVPTSFTILFPPKSPLNQGLDAEHYPQGNGIGLLKLTRSGIAIVTGNLADGTKIVYANALNMGNDLPFYVALYRGKGSISGTAHFAEDNFAHTDLAGANLNWFRPVLPVALYPDGWPGAGILVNLIGSRFQGPQRGVNVSMLPGLIAPNLSGNADFTLTGGDLTAPGGIALSANVDTHNRVTFITPPPALHIKLAIAPTGLLSGTFIHPDTHKLTVMRSVIFQDQNRAAGYFVGRSQAGNMTLEPK